MSWFLLLLAGLFEIAWAYGLKASQGFTRPLPSTLTLLAMVASFGCLAAALRELPLGTAYAIWTGIGTVGTVVLGIFLFDEAVDVIRIGCIAMIVAGIVGLKLITPA